MLESPESPNEKSKYSDKQIETNQDDLEKATVGWF
jgi:hypothetical protein